MLPRRTVTPLHILRLASRCALQRMLAAARLAWRGLRVGLCLLCLQALAVGLLWHKARAELGQRLHRVGPDMLRLADTAQALPRRFHLNGQQLRLRVSSSTARAKAVLDAAERHCRDAAQPLRAAALALPRRHPLSPARARSQGPAALRDLRRQLAGVWREEGEGTGFVACFARTEDGADSGPMATRSLLRRIETALAQGDLSAIGQFRYVYVRRHGRRTRVLELWAEGKLDITAIAPPQGDAPGQDIALVPRPPHSRRILSAWEEGHPQRVALYRVRQGRAGALLRFYRSTLRAAGWRMLSQREKTATAPGCGPQAESLVAEKGTHMVLIVVKNLPEARNSNADGSITGQSFASVLQLH
ncbi:MAG: hypothetical protein ACPGUV_12420 [Polyangiales bacterium]